MSLETYIALILIFVVLLVPLLKWAKDRWVSYSIIVWVNGTKHRISGETLTALVKALVGLTGISKSAATAIIRRYGRRELERDGAWEILAELEGMTVEEYLDYAGSLLPAKLAAKAKRALDVKKGIGVLKSGNSPSH